MKIFITGITGTIGLALHKELQRQGHQIVGYARNPGPALEHKLDFEQGCVSDYNRVFCAMRNMHPDAVIHLAANKHLGACEQHPDDALRINAVGTLNVIEAAGAVGAAKLIYMSTDKAPSGGHVYGMTKLLGEKFVEKASRQHEFAPFVNSIRMGNVLGSTGSVLNIWKTALAQGQRLELRSRNGEWPTRFFVTKEQAAKFVIKVLHATHLLNGSTVAPLMLSTTMGALCAALAVADPNNRVKFTNLGEQEALHEHIFSQAELPHVLARVNDGVVEFNKGVPQGVLEDTAWNCSATAPRADHTTLARWVV